MLRTTIRHCAFAAMAVLTLGGAALAQDQAAAKAKAPSPYEDPGYCRREYMSCLSTSSDKAQCAQAFKACVQDATNQTRARAAQAAQATQAAQAAKKAPQ